MHYTSVYSSIIQVYLPKNGKFHNPENPYTDNLFMVSWVFRLLRKQNGNKFSHHGKFGVVVSIVDVPFIQTLTKREIMVNCHIKTPKQ